MPPRDPNLEALWAEVRTDPSPLQTYLAPRPRPIPYRNATPPRPMPRVMRPANARMRDQNEGVRRQATSELQLRDRIQADLPRREAYAPPRNQIVEAGQMALESTGLPSIRRGTANVARGAMNADPNEGLRQTGAGAVELGLGGLGVAGLGVAPRMAPRLPARAAQALPEPMPRGQQRMPLTSLEEFDPIDGFRPWDLRGASLEDSDVVTALRAGRLKAEPYVEGAPWSAQDHAERIAWLIRNDRGDPITLSRDSVGAAQVEDGYHRLAAARLRGDRDIPIRYRQSQAAFRAAPREIAPNGMTIRPPEPFRNSLRGGSEDLFLGDPPALQAPTLPPQGFTRPQAQGTSPAIAPPPRRDIFGAPNRPGVRDMQPEGIYGLDPQLLRDEQAFEAAISEMSALPKDDLRARAAEMFDGAIYIPSGASKQDMLNALRRQRISWLRAQQ